MIKVRLLTGVAAAGAAALSIPSVVGCNGDTQEDVGNGAAAETSAVNAGTGTISQYGYNVSYASTSAGGDEFIRVGEKITASVDFDSLVQDIAYYDAALTAALRADPSKLATTMKVSYKKFDETTFDGPSQLLTWVTGTGAGARTTGTSNQFTIPAQVKAITVTFAAKYTDTQGQPRDYAPNPQQFVVFGGFDKDKYALFDSNGATPRMRIIEGGGAVPGKNVTIAYTDWRLDTLSSRSSLDLKIGKTRSQSRFGTSIVDAFGNLGYEVSAVYSTDGGATYQPLAMPTDRNDDLFRNESWRYTAKGQLLLPQSVTGDIHIAFHIVAVLTKPPYMQLTEDRYPGQNRIVLKDFWDNNGCSAPQPGTCANYIIPVQH